MTMSGRQSESCHVRKSENDTRDYKYLVLNNKTRMLLISDPTTEKAATSANFMVGSATDPDKVPGIAHFCEHMLFLGTEKFPDEGEYTTYVAQHGGYVNAYTSGENTNYFFDVKAEALFGTLDRFAQFFIAPLFNADMTDRELNAIESEHQMGLLSDHRRNYEITKSISKPGHGHGKFGCGNLETLKTIPDLENISIRDLLLDFHTKYYSANIMTVAVLGKETIAELESFCVPLFEQVQNADVVIPPLEAPFGDDELQVMIKIPAIKETKTLKLQFALPDLRDHYKSNPGSYINELIGHEGEGSLLSLLKKKLWVNALYTSIGCGGLKGFDFLSTHLELTDEGLDNIYEIISIFFQYINMLKHEGPKQWIYDEMKTLQEIDFRFKDVDQPMDYVLTLANNMQLYEPEDVLCGQYCRESFENEMISEILNHITPANFRCTVQAQIFEGKTDRNYRYYNAAFSVEKIPAEKIEEWTTIAPHSDLRLPKRNVFLPDSLDISVTKEEKEEKSIPVLFKDGSLFRVWYKEDDSFFLPKAVLKFQVTSPFSYMTPLKKSHTEMFVKILEDELVEFSYDAELAGLRYRIKTTDCGFSISISGYNDKQLVLLKKILEHIVNLDVKESRFGVLKAKYTEELKNVVLREPLYQASDFFKYVKSENLWSAEEKLGYLHDLSAESLKCFIPEMLKNMYIESFVSGNLLTSDVQGIVSVVEDMLIKPISSSPLLPIQHIRPREYDLANDINYLYQKRSKIHATSCILFYYQVGLQNTRINILCDLYEHIISSHIFNTLRTKEQLGYAVGSGVTKSDSVVGVSARIQSDKEIKLVVEKMEEFFESLEEFLRSMSDEDYQEYIDGLAAIKLVKPKFLDEEAREFWNEIMPKQYSFRRKNVELEELQNITKDDVIQFHNRYISPVSKDRKRLVVIVPGKDAEYLSGSEKNWHVIEDVLNFKASRPLHSHVLPANGIPLVANTKTDVLEG